MIQLQRPRFSTTSRVWLALVVAAASLVATGGHAAAPKTKAQKFPPACGTCFEKRAVLDPDLFSRGYPPEVKMAYSMARRYPETLDRIHCFCECQESTRFQHKTLLTCFTDPHAAGCEICLEEALVAGQLKARGIPDAEIARRVERPRRTEAILLPEQIPGE